MLPGLRPEHLPVPSPFDINRTLQEYQLPWESILDGSFLGGQYPAVPLEAFSDQPFLFLKKRNDIHQRGMQMCENAGFRPRIVMYLGVEAALTLIVINIPVYYDEYDIHELPALE